MTISLPEPFTLIKDLIENMICDNCERTFHYSISNMLWNKGLSGETCPVCCLEKGRITDEEYTEIIEHAEVN